MKYNTNRQISVDMIKNEVNLLHFKSYSRLFTSFNYVSIVIFCILVIGCASTQQPAPVVDRALNDFQRFDGGSVKKDGFYTVQRGDTLYSIAVKHGIAMSELAKWNGIVDPGAIEPGQQISLSIPSTKQAQPSVFPLGQLTLPDIEPSVVEPNEVVEMSSRVKHEPKGLKLPYSDQTLAEMQYAEKMPTATPATNVGSTVNKAARIEAAPVAKPSMSTNSHLNNGNIQWIWPAEGQLIEGFSKDSKGVRISGESGQAVFASATGEVVYSGSGLRGYGKLIIIKHNNTFLSAYAYNSKLLVKEGDRVTKGQKIAEMGNTDTDTVKLHFEIREQGKPVDPLKYLPSRSG